ncbi:hypothetical protein SAMN05443665_105018 [Actinomadura meyerae]|uniref:ChsH2 C-terminal OB-fold domain-containing protein n=1 Tax=Actinomadura meyerae TaxID=240840 RepID=A0A239NUM9_9ACTN|nr:OB-fold domain-containing protein [Actinomadura meyerae]SNT58577.1 hypothetical protein SAMN05443665_105018 [Actinomadura meyerae]
MNAESTGTSGTGRPDPRRPLPLFPEPDTEPWWRATAEHRLLYQAGASGRPVFYPRLVEPGAIRPGVRWRESAGAGTVYSHTVLRQHGHPFFRARLPYVVGFIDLDEGFRMLAEIDADPEEIRIGMRVRVGWEDHDGLSVPVFVPAGGGDSVQ